MPAKPGREQGEAALQACSDSAVASGRARVAEGIAGEEFDELVRLHQRRIYRVLLALVRDPDARRR